ncbi:hypothetical protein KAFR_0D02290 [Kazachstania africana CBS 2517]|uniref:N-acetyltransferase domain-containing protein n=1 Tax=Kazachstania africana (strain ATCC 22294 / BCRC 22015 / CBS 2517 / CECT 1963 / NBRC 1671 / NRRL Y-8276) TaxID=1071382 RepID=H2AU26_KAZAF|nr:hypothetical protein KAFR_0D02290 [Kazachstania africana CBS 2517]CCF57876.1 hypothetical protein KAFR_0D02290 [Kazachstania africana CBS 2517]
MSTNQGTESTENNDITVRLVDKDDKNSWKELWTLFMEFQQTSLPEEQEELNFRRFIDPEVNMWSALAIDEASGRAIGMANFFSHMSTWDLTDIIYLNDLYVREDVRTRGIGRKLIDFVYEHADKMGTPKVYWWTDEHNHRAQLLYTKVGKRTPKVVYKRIGY